MAIDLLCDANNGTHAKTSILMDVAVVTSLPTFGWSIQCVNATQTQIDLKSKYNEIRTHQLSI